MKYCEKCGKAILDNESFYKSENIVLCEDCGDEDLCRFELEDGCYIHNDDYRETYSDDYLSDIVVYYHFENEEKREAILHRLIATEGNKYISKCPCVLYQEIPYCPSCQHSFCIDAPEDEFYEDWDCMFECCKNHHWLKEDDTFKFYSAEEYDGVLFEVYVDDYGQSFHLAWIDPETCEIQEWCCGSYNDYYFDMEDIAASVNEKRGKEHA